jgi:hypothetical protein
VQCKPPTHLFTTQLLMLLLVLRMLMPMLLMLLVRLLTASRRIAHLVHRCLISEDLPHQPHLLGLLGREHPRCEGQLPHRAVVTDNLGEALQRADVRGKADINFFDAELGVGSTVADVAGAEQVDTCASTRTSKGAQAELTATSAPKTKLLSLRCGRRYLRQYTRRVRNQSPACHMPRSR